MLVLRLLPLLAIVPLTARWLYVAQKEHYLPGAAVRFTIRWFTSTPLNLAVGVLLAAGLFTAGIAPDTSLPVSVGMGVIALFWPVGLPFSGIAWTPRMKRVAVVSGMLTIVLVAGVAMRLGDDNGLSMGVVLALAIPDLIVDLALVILRPIERRSQQQWIERARAKLRSVGPSVVAITGSYGKTTTKEYVRRVLSTTAPTLASPASFNNAMGLSRAVNEHLAPGTKWFVAEMGTYGPGEIAQLCEWIPPDIAAITAIGPVHLERFGSLDVTLASKAEIADRARVVVLNCDDQRLADLADLLLADGKRVIRCGTGEAMDVVVTDAGDEWEVTVGGTGRGRVPKVAFPTNLAVAIGIGLAADVPLDNLADAFRDAETPQHRQSIAKGQAGFWIIDNTFNSNPAGASSALETLSLLDSGRKVVVTPGMVELGKEQKTANRVFAAHASRLVDEILVVKQTNRTALMAGAAEGAANVQTFADRASAVAWVRANLGPGDAVLYENDLPAHYP